MKKLRLRGGRALVIVAHPDDETIWMGGVILRNFDIDWTVFSLCRKNDCDRAPKFRRACEKYGASAIISDLEDEGLMDVKSSVPGIEKRIRDNIGNRRFNYIFTHARDGEYGHPRHIGVHLALKNLLVEEFLWADEVFCFAYRLDKKRKIAVPKEKADFAFQLSEKEYDAKKSMIKDLYGFSEQSFEYSSCAKMEKFNAMRLNKKG